MAETARAKIIRARKEGLAHYIKGTGHYTQVLENLERLNELASCLTADDVDGLESGDIELLIRQRNDEFAKRSKLVEHHWRIVDRIIPKQINEPDTDSDEDTVSNVHNVIERLIGERVQRSSTNALPNGSVVPTPIRPQTGGHGDTGSES